MRRNFLGLSLFSFFILLSGFSAGKVFSQNEPSQSVTQDQIDEESLDYFEKWLHEDVRYIITEDEEEIFRKLTTEEEKESFIEQFWFRRDPDLTTANNEYKEEHYRRIAYTNQWFKSGKPGWMTDRGRIYIIHGPPHSIESHPSGGTYQRPAWEGGGFTSTHPFEIWRYRHIDGVGEDVELEFVDPVGGGEYRLALSPDEKDALLNVPGQGLTWAESRGLASKSGRLPPHFNTLREKDSPFRRYEIYSRVQAPVNPKYDDLKEFVDFDVTYDSIPIKVRDDYFRLNDRQVLIPITLELSNKELSYRLEGENHVARVAVYGIVSSLSNRVVTEFEDELVSAYPPEKLTAGLQTRSIYQKVLPLDANSRYKVDLIIKDVHGSKVGVERFALVPPSFTPDRLTASSLLLSSNIRRLSETPASNTMFVIGDIKIHPNLTNSFLQGSPIGVYLQLYNVQIDQATLTPDLKVTYKIARDGDTVKEVTETEEKAYFSVSHQRVILIKGLPAADLKPGTYELTVSVLDLLSKESIDLGVNFKIEESNQAVGAVTD